MAKKKTRQQQRSKAMTRAKRGRSGNGWQWIAVVVVIVVAGGVGIALQSSRSKTENTKVVVPTAAMGPSGSVIEGQPSAKVLVEEYGDFQCPVCRQFHQAMGSTIQQLTAAGTIRFAFHPMNVIDGHSPGSTESVRSASAALCANDAGKFWPYYDTLFDNQASSENSGFLTDDQLVKFGQQVGITSPTFEKCVKSQRYVGYVLKNVDTATQAPRSVNATPTIFINGKQVDSGQLFNAAGTDFDPAKLQALVAQAA